MARELRLARGIRIVTIAPVTIAVCPATAHGATVRAKTAGSGPYGISEGNIIFSAAPGEANRVTVRPVPGAGGTVEVREAGATLAAGDRCMLTQPGVAVCDPSAQFISVMVDAGDGDDQVRVEDLYAIIDGGSSDDRLIGGCQITGDDGNDTLVACANTLSSLGHRLLGGTGNDSIQGGDAAETIDGGGGQDVLRRGGGNDDLSDGDARARAIGADVIDGGAGSDTVEYGDRSRSITVDLSRSDVPQGTAADRDTVREVENVGSGNDVLLGKATRIGSTVDQAQIGSTPDNGGDHYVQ
jgi:Ca2+-binding RTX toxin-like protein